MTENILHGAGSYSNGTCRCDDCTEAHRKRHRAWREERRAARVLVGGRLIAPLPDECHGKPATYTNHQCRCRECSRAWHESCVRYRERRRERAARKDAA